METLKSFVEKNLQKYSKITERKLYGLTSFYQEEKAFALITNDQIIAVHIQHTELKAKYSSMKALVLNDKIMPNWYLIPVTNNKKKNKLSPIFDEVLNYLNKPMTKSKKKKKNKKTQNKIVTEVIEKKIDLKISLFQKLINIFKK